MSEAEADFHDLIVGWNETGMPTTDMANELNARGITNTNGERFNWRMVVGHLTSWGLRVKASRASKEQAKLAAQPISWDFSRDNLLVRD